MKQLSTIIVLFLISFSLYAAKGDVVVKGRILESTNKGPLSYATVSIHKSDSTLVGGATTDENGDFAINNVPTGDYTLKISFIGYKTFETKISKKAGQELNVGEIEIQEDAAMLSSAVVTGRVPVIEQKLDKLVMNVSEAVTTAGSNGIEVLRKAPGISIDKDGNVTLNGNKVDVWIDGRPSYLSGKELETLLLSTDATSIEKIEIMSHPSAKYDASGSGGIINIKTKKNFMKGFNGSVSATYGGMYFDKYYQQANGSLNLGYKSDKTNTTISYSPRYNSMGVKADSKFLFAQGSDYKQLSNMAFDYIGMTHTLRATHDYFINDKNIIGVIVNGSLREDDNSSVGDSFTDTYYKENLISRIKSDNISKSNFDNIGGNLNYTHKFDENKGQELTFNADYYYYDIGGNNYQENKPVDLTKGAFGDDTFRIASNQYLNIISTKADYEQVFWKTGRLETGLKWAQTHTDNNTIKENLIDSEWVKDPSQSNKFIYNEQIAAGYISATKMFGQKWVVKLGVRGEYTYSVGDWKTAGDKTTKNYFNVFPTGYLGYTPSQNWRYSLSYALRIERPGYSQLNPYREYIDANTAMEGNPYLNPQYTDQLSLSVGFKSYLNLALIYQHTRDLIMQNSFYEESTGLKLMKWDNFGTMNMCGAALSITEVPIFKWMIFNGNIFGAYIDNKSSLSSLQNTGFMTSAYLNLTFVLPKDWKIEVGGWGQGKIPIASIIADPAYSLFAGVKKNFLDNKATISLNVTDLLRSQSNTIHMLDQTGFRYYTINQINNVQKVKLSFTYRFGQSKATKRRNVGNLDESSRVGGSSGISTGFEQK